MRSWYLMIPLPAKNPEKITYDPWKNKQRQLIIITNVNE